MREISCIIKKILVECLNNEISTKDLQSNTELVNELNLNSLIYVEFIVRVEDYFKIEISDDYLDMSKYVTYGDLEEVLLRSIS